MLVVTGAEDVKLEVLVTVFESVVFAGGATLDVRDVMSVDVAVLSVTGLGAILVQVSIAVVELAEVLVADTVGGVLATEARRLCCRSYQPLGAMVSTSQLVKVGMLVELDVTVVVVEPEVEQAENVEQMVEQV